MKRALHLVLASLFAVLLFAGPTFGEAEEKPPDWRPPQDSKWDWLQLTSGEWLKGEMEGLRDRDIQFDSDKLDDLVIDWEDVKAFYLRKPHIFRMESDENVQGFGVLRGDVLTITNDAGSAEHARDQIVSIIAGDGTELDYWSGYAGGDFTLRDGNTDQVDLSGRAGLRRETANTRWKADYRGIYGKVDGSKTTDNHRASTALDIFVTSRFYVTVPFFEYYKDEFQNLRYRASPGAGLGYEFVRNRWAELDVMLGAAYQRTEFEEVEAGEDDYADDAAAVLRATLDLDLPHGVELDNLYQLNLVVTELDLTTHHFESTLSTDIWGPLELDLTFMLDRIENPPADSNGDEPDSTDIRIMAGLSIDF